MCRGDSTRDGCYTCLNSSIHDLTATCPNQKEALSWGGDPPCMARYADRPFFGILELGGYNTGDITLNITEFDTVWESLIDSVVRKASTGSSMYPMLLLRLQLWEGGRFSSRTLVIIVVPIAIFGAVLVILAVAFLLKRIKKTKQDGQNNKTHVESLQFGFTAVRVAIENFSDANMLGRGGFGSVYKWIYMAPEYAWHGQYSVKSDVYAFGVLVVEITSGQKINSYSNQAGDSLLVLTDAWRNWNEGSALGFAREKK
ncbi:hypothetical protein V6N13_033398 [Hibiscus sabdariffa]